MHKISKFLLYCAGIGWRVGRRAPHPRHGWAGRSACAYGRTSDGAPAPPGGRCPHCQLRRRSRRRSRSSRSANGAGPPTASLWATDLLPLKHNERHEAFRGPAPHQSAVAARARPATSAGGRWRRASESAATPESATARNLKGPPFKLASESAPGLRAAGARRQASTDRGLGWQGVQSAVQTIGLDEEGRGGGSAGAWTAARASTRRGERRRLQRRRLQRRRLQRRRLQRGTAVWTAMRASTGTREGRAQALGAGDPPLAGLGSGAEGPS